MAPLRHQLSTVVPLWLSIVACDVPVGAAAPGPLREPEILMPAPQAAVDRGRWSLNSLSPQPSPGAANEFEQLCAAVDGGLQQVAQYLAEQQATGAPAPGSDQIRFELHVAGVPNVWPHVWGLAGTDRAEALEAFSRWLGTFTEGGERRCGVAIVPLQGDRVLTLAVALDAIANQAPLPQFARAGQWLKLRAFVDPSIHSAEVALLGPSGNPRKIPHTIHSGRLDAPFVVDKPGRWLLQTLVHTPEGPRVALESLIFVGETPPQSVDQAVVPGEHQSASGDPELSLWSMLNAARRTEGRSPLQYSTALQSVAREHAQQMAAQRRLAHDLGTGTHMDRIHRSAIDTQLAGENIAQASTPRAAHRVLWQSPAHRNNMLREDYTHGAVGVFEDAAGRLWVCEVFAALP